MMISHWLTSNDPPSNKMPQPKRRTLQSSTNHHNRRPQENSPPPPQQIANPDRRDSPTEAADIVRRNRNPLERRAVILLRLREALLSGRCDVDLGEDFHKGRERQKTTHDALVVAEETVFLNISPRMGLSRPGRVVCSYRKSRPARMPMAMLRRRPLRPRYRALPNMVGAGR